MTIELTSPFPIRYKLEVIDEVHPLVRTVDEISTSAAIESGI